MEYTLFHAFKTYVTMIEHFRSLEAYRSGAQAIRNGLPHTERGEFGFHDVSTVKQFVEQVLVEEDEILELICEDDAAATIGALTDDSKKIIMTNPDEIKEKIFLK